jgi:HTH-type transcriptional repressor of NAD biosynthesis genes
LIIRPILQEAGSMSSFEYLKTAIRQQSVTLQQVAEACGMTKGYLSQLLNAKIKSPSAQKLEALHRFLGLEFPRREKTVGVVFGKFYPLHTGHIYLIQRAASQVDELHIIMGFDETRDRLLFEDSAMSQQPTTGDRLRWLLQTFKYQKNIRIHSFNEEGMEPYPHGWDVWSRGIKAFMESKGISADRIYTSEEGDAPRFTEQLGIETVLIDPQRTFMNISGGQIRENPFRYWEYIPTEVKPFFVRTVAILGGESSGKSWMVNKLANIFNTTSAWEYGRDYVFSHLGGDEMALQYSDYDKIAIGHAQYVDFAVKYANKVAFIDTDFVTTQAFCKKYEGREHPFVQALIDEYRFDLVILLENNTPWVADGLRSLGSDVDRKSFQDLLVSMLKGNNISFVHVEESDYDSRFLRCVELVKEMIGGQG